MEKIVRENRTLRGLVREMPNGKLVSEGKINLSARQLDNLKHWIMTTVGRLADESFGQPPSGTMAALTQKEENLQKVHLQYARQQNNAAANHASFAVVRNGGEAKNDMGRQLLQLEVEKSELKNLETAKQSAAAI
jgi:uncharacterized protein YeaC (DUF1315 family)